VVYCYQEVSVNKIVMAVIALLLLAAPGWSGTYPLGVGLHSGYDMPVLQEDIGAGTMWGLSVRGNIVSFLHGQLIVRGTSQGDAEEELDLGNETETITFAGGTLTGFGFNLLMAKKDPAGFWPYFMLGVSSNSLSPGESFKKDESNMGWTVGGGAGINLYQRKVYLDVNTGLLVMPIHDNKASRKNWQTMIGVQYFIPIKTK
jgi:opacity protein-like surface antigen